MKTVTNHGHTHLNNIPVADENVQKHLCLLFDVKLNFLKPIDEKFKKEKKLSFS